MIYLESFIELPLEYIECYDELEITKYKAEQRHEYAKIYVVWFKPVSMVKIDREISLESKEYNESIFSL